MRRFVDEYLRIVELDVEDGRYEWSDLSLEDHIRRFVYYVAYSDGCDFTELGVPKVHGDHYEQLEDLHGSKEDVVKDVVKLVGAYAMTHTLQNVLDRTVHHLINLDLIGLPE